MFCTQKRGFFRNGVDTVWVAGKVLAEGRRLKSADEAEVLAEGAARRQRRIRQILGGPIS
ncbi:hypothetical protein H8S23_05900 [Anaerofilum sp. BX8]|uniref:Uncharacterized protein n=1 Tax=Anaerofilum hominis TaxID=2763016 RepID=A0A923L0X0_9FIRM|nr:hypothetical protein [Anaerofilum hominis]MBC5581032.1 hypothetical protein [Anaerofilum hominis]